MIKALSLKQPLAELIVLGRKIIETRKWKTSFRGEFFVHASLDKKYFKYAEELGLKDLTTGALIGKAELIGVKEYNNKEEFDKDYDKHFAKTFVRYGFILKNAKKIEPTPCKGRLNFFEVK